MVSEPSPLLADELAAALAWWRDAGVDRSYRDEPENWLADRVVEIDGGARPSGGGSQVTSAEPPPVRTLGGNREAWPDNLTDFHAWWLGESTLDEGGSYPRVPPRGNAGADLMVVVPMPEECDEVQLLCGPHGRTLEAMLDAMGIAGERTYVTAVLPRHTAMPDWSALTDAGLGAVLSYHLALAAPKRAIAFGSIIPPLLGHDAAQEPAPLRIFNHEGSRVPVMAAEGLERLLRSAAARAAFWRRWQDWTDETDEADATGRTVPRRGDGVHDRFSG